VARRTLRAQALAWLRAELDLRSGQLDLDQPEARRQITGSIESWKADPDLAGVRDPRTLEALPDDERDGWRTFWSDADALLARLKGAAN
jgi:hypothetical protein